MANGQNGEKVARKLPHNRKFLDYFTKLSTGNEKERAAVTEELIKHLKSTSNAENKDSTGDGDLQYTLKRLVRGVASPHKWARLGFALALTQVARYFPDVTMKSFLKLVKKNLSPEETDTKAEVRDKQLGQVMVVLSLLQAGRLNESMSSQHVEKMVEIVITVMQNRPPLGLICTQALSQFTSQSTEEQFAEGMWPALQNWLANDDESLSADQLYLLMVARSHHKVTVKKFCKKKWGNKNVLSEDKIPQICDIIASSTTCHPVVHPVGPLFVATAIKHGEILSPFWTALVGKLCKGDTSGQFLCYQLIPDALRLSTSAEEVSVILNKSLVLNIVQHLVQTSKILHPAAKTLMSKLVEVCRHWDDGELQFALLSQLISHSSSLSFDVVTKTRTVASMIQSLKPEAAVKFSTHLCYVIKGHGSVKPTVGDEKWRHALTYLCGMLTVVPMTVEDLSWHKDVLRILFYHGFFKSEKQCGIPLSKGMTSSLRDAFFQALKKLSSYQSARGKTKKHEAYITLLYDTVQYADKLLDDENEQLLEPFKEEMTEEWKQMMKTVKKIHKSSSKEETEGQSYAFELLFLQLGLELFHTPQASIDALQEVQACYEKAFQKRQQSVKKIEGPEWIEVFTELLLGLLSQQSVLMRKVVISVFGMLAPHVTSVALKLVLQVLKPGWEADQLDFEDDDAEMDEDEEEGSEENEEEEEDEAENSEEQEEESEESEEEEEVEEVDEELKSQVKTALGNAVAGSDDDDESDLDDEAMFKLDNVLAQAFKSMKRKGKKEVKERKKQLKHFKLKCLELLQVYVDTTPPLSHLMEIQSCLWPLLEWCIKEKDIDDVKGRAIAVLNLICAQRKAVVDDQMMLVDKLTYLIGYASSPSAFQLKKQVTNACLFLARCMDRNMPSASTDPSPLKTRTLASQTRQDTEDLNTQIAECKQKFLNMIHSQVKDFSQKRTSTLNIELMQKLFMEHKVTLWPLGKDLLLYLDDGDTRIYAQTQLLSLLSALLHNSMIKLIDENDFKMFTRQVLTSCVKMVELQISSENPKVLLMAQALEVLFRCFTIIPPNSFKDMLPDDLEKNLTSFRAGKAKDTRKACNKIINQLASMRSKSAAGEDKKKKRKRKRSHSTSSMQSNEGGHSESPLMPSTMGKVQDKERAKSPEKGKQSPKKGQKTPDRGHTSQKSMDKGQKSPDKGKEKTGKHKEKTPEKGAQDVAGKDDTSMPKRKAETPNTKQANDSINMESDSDFETPRTKKKKNKKSSSAKKPEKSDTELERTPNPEHNGDIGSSETTPKHKKKKHKMPVKS